MRVEYNLYHARRTYDEHGLPWPWWQLLWPVGGRGEAGNKGISGMELGRGKEKGLLGVGMGHQFQPGS
jgi:hypothetical protein